MQESRVRALGREDPWGRKRHPAAAFLPGESHGQRSLWATVNSVARVGHYLVAKPAPPSAVLETRFRTRESLSKLRCAGRWRPLQEGARFPGLGGEAEPSKPGCALSSPRWMWFSVRNVPRLVRCPRAFRDVRWALTSSPGPSCAVCTLASRVPDRGA